MDDAIWEVIVFTTNRERLLDGNIAEVFFQAVRPGGSALDARTTLHLHMPISQRKRKRIEECFG